MNEIQVTPDEVWKDALGQIKLQMTKATFDSWVKGTQVVGAKNGTWVVGVKNNRAKEWLENRLGETITRTLGNVVGKAVEIEFVVLDEVPDEEPLRPRSGQAPGGGRFEDPGGIISAEAEVTSGGQEKLQALVFYAAKKKMGRWLPEHQYDRLFVAPYLGGRTFDAYRYLLHHWIKNLRKKDFGLLDVKRPENHCWTPPFRISYRKITLAMGKSNGKIVPGGEYECYKSVDRVRVGQLLTACEGCHDPYDWRPKGDGGRCFYWREGLIHRLYREHLLKIEISATRRAEVQLWRTFPLLSPWQVGQLSEYLQEKHEEWLERYGEEYFGMSVEGWARITSWYMIPMMEDFGTGKLDGVPPENPFLAKKSD